MEDFLLLARWKQSSNKCGPIYHPQHITGELGVIIHASRGMNRPFRGSWAQTLKRASPLSFSLVEVVLPASLMLLVRLMWPQLQRNPQDQTLIMGIE